MIAVTKTAATWLLVKVEMTMPMPVVAVNIKHRAQRQHQKLPLIGTPNTTSAMAAKMKKLIMAMAM